MTEVTSWRRTRRLASVVAVGVGAWAGVSYLLRSVGEARERSRKDEKAREKLRFTELQDNCNFTVMMLLPNVATQILAALDVEGITATLQQKTAAAKATQQNSLQDSYDKLTPSEIRNGDTQAPEPAPEKPGTEAEPAVEAEGQAEGATPDPAAPPVEEIAASQELGSSALGLSGVLPPVEEAPPVVPEQPVDPRTKLELWQEIKMLAFARTVTALYLVTILTVQTNITLNLLGRADYLASVIDMARERGTDGQVVVDDLVAAYAALPAKANEADAETDAKFLTFSWYLLHKGWPLLVERVRLAVEELVGPMSLKAQVTYDELCELFERIRKRVEGDGVDKPFDFLPIYLPSTEAEEQLTLEQGGIPLHRAFVDERLRVLLNETRSLLSSADARQLQRLCLDASFLRMTNSLEPAFKPAGLVEGQQTSSLVAVGGRSARLANLLPSVAKASHAILEGFPNEYVEELKDVPELKSFSAIVFSSFR